MSPRARMVLATAVVFSVAMGALSSGGWWWAWLAGIVLFGVARRRWRLGVRLSATNRFIRRENRRSRRHAHQLARERRRRMRDQRRAMRARRRQAQ